MLHFDEKNGKSREIPVRHDLEKIIFEYLDKAGLRTARKDTPLFRTAYRKTGQLTKTTVHVIDICRMVKRRLKDAGLSVLEKHRPGRMVLSQTILPPTEVKLGRQNTDYDWPHFFLDATD